MTILTADRLGRLTLGKEYVVAGAHYEVTSEGDTVTIRRVEVVSVEEAERVRRITESIEEIHRGDHAEALRSHEDIRSFVFGGVE